MGFTVILPIIFLGLLVFLLFFGVNIGKKYMTLKITHWLVGIYVAILLLASAVLPLFNDSIDRNLQRITNEEEEHVYQKLQEGNPDEIDPIYFKKEMTFDVDENAELSIVPQTTDSFLRVLVERKASDDHTIDALIYSSGLFVDGINFSDKLLPPRLQLDGDQLILTTNFQKLKLGIGANGYPVRQFSGETLFSSHTINSSGDAIIYLKIPQHVHLNADEMYLEYVN